ncbi:MAG: DUF4336 domain-containing protein [Candidatus Binataceae bacterium]
MPVRAGTPIIDEGSAPSGCATLREVGAELQPLGENLWVADGPIVDFYSFPYSTRMAVARLSSGALWIWSPIPLADPLRAELAALGRPAHLVSPNKIHHLFLGEWKKTFPNAKLWGLPSVIRKRPDLNFTGALADDPPEEWRGEIDQTVFRGSPAMDEVVFFHRASRTAIFADLIENFSMEFLRTTPGWKGWRTAVAKLWKITEPHGYAPLEWRLSFIRRAPARAALARVLGWAPVNAVMAHGTIQRGNAVEFIRKSFTWL